MFSTLSSTEVTQDNVEKLKIIVKLGMTEEINEPEWGAPSFAQSKAKN